MVAPSGDHLGCESLPQLVLIFSIFAPTSDMDWSVDTYATRVLSGDQKYFVPPKPDAGMPSCAAVNFQPCPPSACIRKICALASAPPRADTKLMYFPSGDHCGCA